MNAIDQAERNRLATLERGPLGDYQLMRLNALLAEVLPQNEFYARKLGRRLQLAKLDELGGLPFTNKTELSLPADDDRLCANLTYPEERYVRFHQTSGTRGRPLRVLDTADDWVWWIQTWQYVLDSADVTAADRVALAFSFGPFIGFWSAFDALIARGALAIPLGGMSSLQRLELMRSAGTDLLFCTPSYALHLAETARRSDWSLAELAVRGIVVAGEPGGSIAAVRAQIENAWQARVIDHAGASEIGPWGVADAADQGLQVIESEFIAEFIQSETGEPAEEGELAELVLTGLGRWGSPLIRYRTGDLVRPFWTHDLPRRFVRLAGGVLGRADDMLIVRGVNIFPSSIEEIIRTFPEIVEFRLTATKKGRMDELKIEVEGKGVPVASVADRLRSQLGLRVAIAEVPENSLPRSEMKSRRFVDRRAESAESGP